MWYHACNTATGGRGEGIGIGLRGLVDVKSMDIIEKFAAHCFKRALFLHRIYVLLIGNMVPQK